MKLCYYKVVKTTVDSIVDATVNSRKEDVVKIVQKRLDLREDSLGVLKTFGREWRSLTNVLLTKNTSFQISYTPEKSSEEYQRYPRRRSRKHHSPNDYQK